jgi:hypothetical protein
MVDDLSTLTNEVDDIIEELGPDPQGVYASVRVRLDILEARINNPLAPAPGIIEFLSNPVMIYPDGVTIATGTGAPSSLSIPGSLYLRQDGYISLYSYSDGYGWLPVMGGSGGGGGGSLPPTSGNQFAVLMENPANVPMFARLTQDMILPTYTIALAGGTLVEVSQTVNTPAFTASYNRTPSSAVLTDSEGNTPKNVIATPNSFSSNFNFTKNSFAAAVVFTLTSTDGYGVSKNTTTTYTWGQKTYHGVAAAGQTGQTFIKSLTGVLSTSIGFNFTDNAGPTQKIYYASRAAYGTPTFTVGGFSGGFTLVSNSISVTNTYGFTENYQLWESDNLGLGSTTVVVS